MALCTTIIFYIYVKCIQCYEQIVCLLAFPSYVSAIYDSTDIWLRTLRYSLDVHIYIAVLTRREVLFLVVFIHTYLDIFG